MDKTASQTCPQCHHLNELHARECELCEWQLTLSSDETVVPDSVTPMAGTDMTVDPNAITQEIIDPNLTVAPAVLAAEKAKVTDEKTFNLAGDLAHFEVLEVLGQGGMGMVYHAKDRTLDRDVALKMLRPMAGNNINTEVLLDEARMASKLNHPNIVTIYDVARTDNSNYIVMEWVDGKPLDELIPEEGLPLETAMAYACQIAEGLSSAHKKYIIHRDIKPQNIMLSEQNTLKILDFGIAGLVEHLSDQSKVKGTDGTTNSKTTPSAGTPSYMSPEQAQGLNLDQRSDIFSFGIVLYQMLTGKRAFIGENAMTVKQAICAGDYAALNEVKPDLPVNVVQTVHKMLATAKDERWQSTAELAAELNNIHDDLTHSKNWWQRQHWLAKAAMVLPFILALGWTTKDILFPATTQQLIEQQLSEATKVAILPFDNISGDPTLQLFGDGLAVNLSTDLATVASEIGDTWIVPATEISRMKEVTPKTVADKYGVELILSGSMQHMGSTRLMVLNLIDAQSGQQLKTTEVSINADDLFAGHALVRESALELLDWQISDSLATTLQAERPDLDGAYKYYVEGKGNLYRFDQSGNADKALKSFQRAIDIDDSYENAYVGLAETQLRKFHKTGEPQWLDDMQVTINKLASKNSNYRLISYLAAELNMKKGAYEKANELYKSSIEQNQNHVLSHIGHAKALTKIGQADMAEKIYQEVIDSEPNNWRAVSGFGIFYFQTGNYQGALQQFERLSVMSPNNNLGVRNMAAAYYALGNIEQAIKYTRDAIKIKPSDRAYSNLGTMLFYEGKYDDSIPAFKKAIKLKDNHYVHWGNLGDALRLTNDTEMIEAFARAIELAELSMEINPNDSSVISDLAYFNAVIGNNKEAIEYAKLINANDTGNDHYMTALAYDAMENSEMGIVHLKQAIKKKYPIDEILNSPLLTITKDHKDFIKLSSIE